MDTLKNGTITQMSPVTSEIERKTLEIFLFLSLSFGLLSRFGRLLTSERLDKYHSGRAEAGAEACPVHIKLIELFTSNFLLKCTSADVPPTCPRGRDIST